MASLADELMATAGDTIVLSASREPEAIARDGQEATLSREAFDGLADQMRVWVGSRMVRHHERTGRGVHNLEVTVTVNTAAGPLEVGGEAAGKVRLSVIDGRLRVEAMRS